MDEVGQGTGEAVRNGSRPEDLSALGVELPSDDDAQPNTDGVTPVTSERHAKAGALLSLLAKGRPWVFVVQSFSEQHATHEDVGVNLHMGGGVTGLEDAGALVDACLTAIDQNLSEQGKAPRRGRYDVVPDVVPPVVPERVVPAEGEAPPAAGGYAG